MDIQRLKGFRDLLPDETPLWQRIEAAAREVFGRYGFEEVRLPLLEETALFCRSIGEATDIVEKEMYTFLDTGGTSVTLRPEGTASAVRSYLENGLHHSETKARHYYLGPMFRRERPQKGRLRQFHQIGAECFGWAEPWADADVLCLLWDLFAALGLSERVRLEVNSLGCADDRRGYVARLREHLTPRQEALCENCRRRLQSNPLRVLDCKSAHCRAATQDAPSLEGSLCGDCAAHFDLVRSHLTAQGLPFAVNHRMVRGLDYYNRTTFELLSGDLGAQNAVAAGGRYDGLVETLGGPPVPALGFALGVERLALLLGTQAAPRAHPDAYLVHRGTGALEAALLLRRGLARAGVRTEVDYEERSFKAQLRSANRSGARLALLLGEDEVAAETVAVKDLAEGTQETVGWDRAASRVAELLASPPTPSAGRDPHPGAPHVQSEKSEGST
ncbi:MAG: histidine--tRNA ligase [Deferrisomatales bacterium]|nr:histidine--tRNA ligase [Deferrisomatales bacterium]